MPLVSWALVRQEVVFESTPWPLALNSHNLQSDYAIAPGCHLRVESKHLARRLDVNEGTRFKLVQHFVTDRGGTSRASPWPRPSPAPVRCVPGALTGVPRSQSYLRVHETGSRPWLSFFWLPVRMADPRTSVLQRWMIRLINQGRKPMIKLFSATAMALWLAAPAHAAGLHAAVLRY